MERKKVKTETEDWAVTITKNEFFDIAASEIGQFLTFIQHKLGREYVEITNEMLTAVVGEIAIKMFKED